jgi:hypothetical protein
MHAKAFTTWNLFRLFLTKRAEFFYPKSKKGNSLSNVLHPQETVPDALHQTSKHSDWIATGPNHEITGANPCNPASDEAEGDR